MMTVAVQQRFAYDQTMPDSEKKQKVSEDIDAAVCDIASAIGEPARARMLFRLIDGHARTATELAVVAEVSPSTASAHLSRLTRRRLLKIHKQGRHRYFSLYSPEVAGALESLSVLAGGVRNTFVPNTPDRLRSARTCYDHIAGTLGVGLHDWFTAKKWIAADSEDSTYTVTAAGREAFPALGIDLDAPRSRRRFAYSCLDWSERRPHLGGALAAAVLDIALRRKWVAQELDSRVLTVTSLGRREFRTRFSLIVEPPLR
jgi:DNA-binding transcriptional ArsR family regulator